MRLHSWTGGSLRRVYIGQFLSLQRIYYMTELDNVLFIIIALVNTKTGFNLSETHEVWNKARGLKKKKLNTIPTFLLIPYHTRCMVIITVIWLSLSRTWHLHRTLQMYHLSFISSHIKVSRSSLEPNLSTWQFYFPSRLFFLTF